MPATGSVRLVTTPSEAPFFSMVWTSFSAKASTASVSSSLSLTLTRAPAGRRAGLGADHLGGEIQVPLQCKGAAEDHQSGPHQPANLDGLTRVDGPSIRRTANSERTSLSLLRSTISKLPMVER